MSRLGYLITLDPQQVCNMTAQSLLKQPKRPSLYILLRSRKAIFRMDTALRGLVPFFLDAFWGLRNLA